jgi:hypothetical protein
MSADIARNTRPKRVNFGDERYAAGDTLRRDLRQLLIVTEAWAAKFSPSALIGQTEVFA